MTKTGAHTQCSTIVAVRTKWMSPSPPPPELRIPRIVARERPYTVVITIGLFVYHVGVTWINIVLDAILTQTARYCVLLPRRFLKFLHGGKFPDRFAHENQCYGSGFSESCSRMLLKSDPIRIQSEFRTRFFMTNIFKIFTSICFDQNHSFMYDLRMYS